jgi:hypothetical protein
MLRLSVHVVSSWLVRIPAVANKKLKTLAIFQVFARYQAQRDPSPIHMIDAIMNTHKNR